MKHSPTNIESTTLFLALRRRQEREARPRLLHRMFPGLAPSPRRDRGVQFSPTEIVIPNRSR